MQGGYNYNILSNQTYCDKYMYIPYTVHKRSEFVVSMFKHPMMRKCSVDIVRYVIDLAYLPIGRAKELEFHPLYVFNEQ